MKIKINKGKIIFALTLAAVCSFVSFIGCADFYIPDDISVFAGEAIPSYVASNGDVKAFGMGYTVDGVSCEIAEVNIKKVDISVFENKKVILGGMPFGINFHTKGVIIVGLNEIKVDDKSCNPAYDAGLRVKDIICKINGSEVNTVQELTEKIEKSNGDEITVSYVRGGTEGTVNMRAALDSNGVYKAGIWVKDSTAGIGTITFVDPDSKAFGGLGHGICDIDSGELMPLMQGSVNKVKINGVVRGKSGVPGELRGYFAKNNIGSLLSNTPMGVFGFFNELPDGCDNMVPLGLKNEVREGKAYIYTTLDGNTPKKYEVEIIKINSYDTKTKNFIISVTDKELLKITGGIVQGMSGSPVIQNDKLVGAVTHVLINEPEKGYGIFIENMLKNIPEQNTKG